MWYFFALWCMCCVLPHSRGYNIDVDHPIIIEDPAFPSKSYFGSSIALRGSAGDNTWIKIGAPNGSAASRTRTGVVYHCPFMKTCAIDRALNYTSDMDSALIGAAMDISHNYESLAVSASSMQQKSSRSIFVQGMSFIEQLPNKTTHKLLVLKEPTAQYTLPYYGRALSGFSLHFVNDQNELVVGAPGVYNYLGTVFRVKDINKSPSDWKYDIVVPKGDYYEYAGYAVSSGYFRTRTELLYVSGLPRGVNKDVELRQVPYGAVIVFAFDMTPGKFKNQVEIHQTDEIYGTQFGEYFGSALASGDLNGDSLDDLIVAAPFRQNAKSGFDHGSVYVFYGNPRALRHDPKNRIDGSVPGARFGTALMVLGRLDGDSPYPALAISAPNEEDSGVVYVYSYNDALKNLRVIQRIVGKDLYAGLRGFGMSISRATDVDANGILDVAVGSPISGHAVIFRSKPTVTVHASLAVPTSPSKSSTTLVIKCCYYYTGYRSENLTIIRTLKVDLEFGRFYFNNTQFRSNSESKVVQMRREREQCERVTVTKSRLFNIDDPISLELSYELATNETFNKTNPVLIRNSDTVPDDTFCKNCPILSRKSINPTTKLVMWDHLCDHNGRKENCTSKLVVRASFLDLPLENTFVLGNKELLNLRVTVTNRGDPAFMPSLQIFLPSNGIGFVESTNCQYGDTNVIRCDGDEILYDTTTYTVKLNVYAEDTEDRNLLISASTITDNVDDRSSLNVTLKLRREADLLITGYSEESSYVYQEGSTILVQNLFKIEKFGSSPSLPAEITVKVPYKMKSANSNEVQFTSVVLHNSVSPSHNPLMSCKTIDHSEDVTGPVKSNGESNSTIYRLDCDTDGIICAQLRCDLAPLVDWKNHAEFPVNMEVDLAKLEVVLGRDFLALTDQVVISIEARISTNFTQTGDRADFATQSNIILVDKKHKIPLWILICSLVVGFLILIVVTVLLAKLGFFERKKHNMLRQLKEEALEEEKVIEEMIRKESEAGEPLESDIMFRYISPKDLDIHWKHMGKHSEQDEALMAAHSPNA